MNTLLFTNILLLVIVAAIVVLSVLVSILLIYVIGTAKRVKNIVREFDDDIHRARSFFGAVREKVVEFFGKKK